MVNSIFKSVEVSGETKELALANAPFKSIAIDATAAFRNWKKKQTTITEANKRQFMVDYVAKHKNLVGVGYFIVDTPAVLSTRERPYKFNDVKNEKGKRRYKTMYVIKDAETGKVLGKSDVTKADSKNVAKELFKKGFKGKMVCTYEKQVTEGEPVAWTAEYVPSKGSHNGTYTVFGIIEA